MPCWLFMAWFHIHLSAPSHQMGLRIYAFLQQWCYQSGKLPLDGRRDNKKGYTTGSIPQHSFVFSQQHKCVRERLKRLSQMARRYGLVKKKKGKKNFCRFNFLSISWNSNFGCTWLGHLWLFVKWLCVIFMLYCYCLVEYLYFSSVQLFFVVVISFSLVYAGHRHQGELDHIQLWLSKADWIPKPISLQKEWEKAKKYASARLSSPFLFSSSVTI